MQSSSLADAFGHHFSGPPHVLAAAPGRVNLMGEHTDYNGGHVLPMALPQQTHVALRLRDDGRVCALSRNMGADSAILTYRVAAPARVNSWLDYIQGITWALAQAGHGVPGADLYIDSQVPVGSGVSSSAALEIAVLRALRQALALPLDDIDLARLGQQCENGFVGANVGIMDQMAASVAVPGSALYLDTAQLTFEHVPLPPAIELAVINSGVPHSNAAGAYNTRRAECQNASERLGVTHLCELGLADLPRLQALPPLLLRRARHVVTENLRVAETVQALRAGDARRVGALFQASHASQRDDYEVSVAAVDQLVELACRDADVFGARLTGGGFGGCVVLVTKPNAAAAAAARISAAYQQAVPYRATTVLPLPGNSQVPQRGQAQDPSAKTETFS